ncbi:hypothetical protein [Roseomonas elaeocarpi]|uniref:Uncharacterized protein n=1 Tax=Roseomonas elaeocarpi TaxID=907779 RepID=A0ABV6JRW8_9PROT
MLRCLPLLLGALALAAPLISCGPPPYQVEPPRTYQTPYVPPTAANPPYVRPYVPPPGVAQPDYLGEPQAPALHIPVEG